MDQYIVQSPPEADHLPALSSSLQGSPNICLSDSVFLKSIKRGIIWLQNLCTRPTMFLSRPARLILQEGLRDNVQQQKRHDLLHCLLIVGPTLWFSDQYHFYRRDLQVTFESMLHEKQRHILTHNKLKLFREFRETK